jgi:hypothetical protein
VDVLLIYRQIADAQAACVQGLAILSTASLINKELERHQIYEIVDDGGSLSLWNDVYGCIATLDAITQSALVHLQRHANVHFTAVVESKILRHLKIKVRTRSIFPLSINIYGKERDGDNVGDLLGNKSVFLQHPAALEDALEYYNPQYYYPYGHKTSLNHLVGLSDAKIRAKQLSDEVDSVLDSLNNSSESSVSDDTTFALIGVKTPLKGLEESSQMI